MGYNLERYTWIELCQLNAMDIKKQFKLEMYDLAIRSEILSLVQKISISATGIM